MRATRLWLWSWAAVVVVSATVSQAAKTKTWYVGNNGDDAFVPSCGTKTLPCRSVGQAITLAAPGDTIIVGPGVYGDLNGSGTLGDFPGEDARSPGSMIIVDKPLTIVSRDGAFVTVLDANGGSGTVVDIQASGTVFGKAGKGFTIRNAATHIGLVTEPTVGQVTVQGNIAAANTMGFYIQGTGGVRVLDNVARLNGVGFYLLGSANVMQSNRAISNNEGFIVTGDAHKVKQNVAAQNSLLGFEIDVQGGALNPVADFSGNAALANAVEGIRVAAPSGLGADATVVIKKSNIFGNGDTANNCGVVVVNNDPTDGVTVTAKGNFWGTASGIGANPADSVGGPCTTDAGGGVTVDTSAPAAKEFGVSEKPLK